MRHPVLPFCLLLLFAVTCVEPGPASEKGVTALSLSQETAEMIVGETVHLQLTILPKDAVYEKVMWASSRQYVASVSDDGVVTAVGEGVSTVTASAGGKYVTCKVTVENGVIPVTSISLDKTSIALTKGLSETVKATVGPDNATNKTVGWTSSDPEKVAVDKNGTVTALGGGSAIITASSGNQAANCLVTVTVPVEKVRLDRTSYTMDVGGIITLTATVLPEDASDKTVKWTSSNSPIIGVDGYGNVTAFKEGTTVITAKAGGKTAACTINSEVKPVPVEVVSLDRHEISLERGQTTVLIANVSPGNATDKTVSWSSSEPDLVSVDDDGRIIAIATGEATVTARAGAAADYCTVRVREGVVPVTAVTLDRTSVSLIKGQSDKLTANVSPSNATDAKVTWSSADATMVSVDGEGVIMALKGGTTAIKAAAGEKSAVCVVTVTVPVRSVLLDRYLLEMKVGDNAIISATISPSDATEKTITWSSSDPSVATVDKNGNVSALKKGKASVSAHSGGVSASCAVEVANIPLSIDPSSVYLTGRGGKFDVTVTGSAGFYVKSSPDWVSERGTNGQVSSFEVGVNRETEERSGIIVFCDEDGVSQPCTVKQAPGGPFAISPDKVAMGAAGGTFEIKVSCPTEYHIKYVPEWIKEISDGSVLQLHKFQAAKNTGLEPRSGVIQFCDDEGTCLSCTVTQKNETEGATGGNEDLDNGEPINW